MGPGSEQSQIVQRPFWKSKELQMKRSLLLSEVSSLCMKALTSPRILLNRSSAVSITKVIVAAERSGSKSHGLFRLPGYCAGVLHSKVDPTAEPKVTDVAPSVVVCDAQHGYAPLAFERSTPLLVEKTKTNGCVPFKILFILRHCGTKPNSWPCIINWHP